MNITVIVLAAGVVVYAVVGTPSIVTNTWLSVESPWKSSLVAVVYSTVEPSPVKVSRTLKLDPLIAKVFMATIELFTGALLNVIVLLATSTV